MASVLAKNDNTKMKSVIMEEDLPTTTTTTVDVDINVENKCSETNVLTNTETIVTTFNRLKYGRVLISLENPILSRDVIENTPSVQDGLDASIENDLRLTGCRLIQVSGILLRLPQVAMATGQVLFQRYYYCKSFVRFPMEITAMACVVLACKVEEAPRRIRDVINVFHNMKQTRLQQPLIPLLLDENYVNLKNQVIKSERRILKELGFCVHVKHPHKFIVAVAQILKNENNTELIQTAWSYMNDSLQSNVFVRYPPETIACACIHLSSRVLRAPLPEKPLWYHLFNVDTETINEVCLTILKLYVRKTLPQEELEAKVEEVRKKLELTKIKAKNQQIDSGNTVDNSVDSIGSQTNSPKYLSVNNATTKNLELLSVINRLKENKKSPTTEPKLADSAVDSDQSITALSTPSTPLKLQKSPETLKNSKLPAKYRKDYDSEHSNSSIEPASPKSKRKSHKNNNGHNDEYKYNTHDRYRDQRTPPSRISSTIITDGYNNTKRDYKRHHSRSRSPSPYGGVYRYKSHRIRDDYRDERFRDDRTTQRNENSRHYKDDNYKRSRSRSPYTSSKHRYHKSNRKSKY